MTGFITDHAMKPGDDHGKEFEFGLALTLDGLESLRQAGAGNDA